MNKHRPKSVPITVTFW